MDFEAARELILDYLGEDARFAWEDVNEFRVFNGLRRLKPDPRCVCLKCGCTFESWDVSRNRLCYECNEENSKEYCEIPLGSLNDFAFFPDSLVALEGLVFFSDSSDGDGGKECVVLDRKEKQTT